MTTDSQARILNHFFSQPEKEIHIRALARKTGLHPNTVINATDELQKAGMLRKREEGGRIRIAPNTKEPYFQLRKRAHHIEQLYRSGLIKALEEHYFHPTIVLFGSIAKGDDRSDSDIDLLIITDNDQEQGFEEYEKKLGRAIQLFVHNKEGWRNLKKNNTELANNIINGIVLEGYLEVLQ